MSSALRKYVVVLIVLSSCLCLCLSVDLFLASLVVVRNVIPVSSPVGRAEIDVTPTVVRTPVSEESLATLEQLRETIVLPRDLYSVTQRLKQIGNVPRIVNDVAPEYVIGQSETFWVSDEALSDTYFTVEATLRYATAHAYMWVEDGLRLEQAGIEASAHEFEERIYPTDRQYFGSEWSPGVDNDVHIHILNANLPSVGGYYSSNDEYPTVANPFSNEKEIIYINAAAASPGSEPYNSTLAHEFEHMIHWNVDPNEDTWVNEGSAQTAEALNGYQLWPALFLAAPDTQLTAWADEIEDAGVYYDASFLFMYYFAERFGPELVRELTATEADGTTGFDEVLAANGFVISFEDVFQDWIIANYLNDAALGDGRYGYGGLELPTSVAVDDYHHRYPVERSSTVHQYAADYVELEPGRGDLVIDFTGSTQVKLVDNDPHSGLREWWSNRGDVSDMTLTRAFDLTGLEQATLEFWLWYDIEDDYDYAYVEVSTDGGQTWNILRGDYTTDTNPNGNNFGQGYTGVSGGGAEPVWVKERIELTPYAGREVMIRFEYITDDSYTDVGLCLDDIAIPEADYYYDAESVDGWEAEGFVLSNNILPQEWVVEVVEFGDTVTVEEMELSQTRWGQLKIEDFGDRVKGATLVIAALAPATTEIASYEYSLQVSD
jgi:immune inhibitor A